MYTNEFAGFLRFRFPYAGPALGRTGWVRPASRECDTGVGAVLGDVHSLIMDWTVYIIRCDDGTLYTGVTTDLERRFREHRDLRRGARYFNGRKPQEVAYRENGHDRSSACRREAAIKKLSRDEKLHLIRGGA